MKTSDKALIIKTLEDMYSWTKKELDRLEADNKLKNLMEKRQDVLEQIREVDTKISEGHTDIKKVRFLCERYKELIKKLIEPETDDSPFDVDPKEKAKEEIKKISKSVKSLLNL